MAADATMYESKRKGKNRVVARTLARARRTGEAEAARIRGRRAGESALGEGRAVARRNEARTGRQAAEARGAEPARGEGRRTSRGSEGERGTQGPSAGPGQSRAGRTPRNTPRSAPTQGTSGPESRRRRLPGTQGDEGGPPRATRRFQVLGDQEEEQIGRIMRQLLGPPAAPRPIATIEAAPQGEADNRPA
jgi:hypothetical protein